MDFLQQAQDLLPQMISWRRVLHQHPEVGMELPHTTAFVMDTLSQLGYTPRELPHGGVTALVGAPSPSGSTILLRADMDALPMEEESGLPFASTNPQAAHCCGHDMHTAALLGAAKLLKDQEHTLQGQVKLMFQPAEETLLGAKSMIADGILEQPKVTGAVMMHMAPLVESGMVLYGEGTVAASSDVISITVTGKGGHGARPALAVDPINAACHIHLALQALLSRETDAMNPAVLTFGSFHAGTAENIIPSQAVMRGTLRTYQKELRNFLLPRVEEIATLTAQAFRATAKVEIEASIPPLTADSSSVERVGKAFAHCLGDKAQVAKSVMSGSEDFAEISDLVPSVCFLLGGGNEAEGCHYGIHHPKVLYKEESLVNGCAAYACAAVALLDKGAF